LGELGLRSHFMVDKLRELDHDLNLAETWFLSHGMGPCIPSRV
jgi:hypothetical protein